MNSHRMLIDAAEQMADLGVQGAPVKKKPDLMDDRTFNSLHLLDRLLADEISDFESTDVNIDVGGIVNNVRTEIIDGDSSEFTTEQIESVGKRTKPEKVEPVKVQVDLPKLIPTLYEPTVEHNEAVEKELHELFKLTDTGTAGVIEALAANTAMIQRMGDVLGDWFDWEREQAFRNAAHEENNVPSVYGGNNSSDNNGSSNDGPDADFPDMGGTEGGRSKRKKPKPNGGRNKKSWAKRAKKWLSRRKGKAQTIALLALMGVAAYGAYEDKQSSKYHAGEDADSDAPDVEDAEHVDSEETDAPEAPEEAPSLTEQILPRDPMDQAAVAATTAMAAPSAVSSTKALVAAKSAGGSVLKTTVGAATSGAKGVGMLTVGLGAYDAYQVHEDKTLTGSQKNKEYAKIGGRTAGSMAGYGAGAALGTTVGATVGSVIPVVGTVLGGIAGNLIGGYLGSILGGEAGEKISEYVVDKVQGEEVKHPPIVDTQPIVDVLREAHEEDVKLQEEQNEKDKDRPSMPWLFNSPLRDRPSAGAVPPMSMSPSNWGDTFNTSATPVGSGIPFRSAANAPGQSGTSSFTPGSGATPSLIHLTDDQKKIINEATGGDAKAARFLTGVLGVENRGFGRVREDKVSSAGAVGGYQFMPDTWNGLVAQGKASGSPRNFGDASRAAMSLYKELNATYKGNEVAMVAHYNGGNAGGRATKAGQGDLSGLKQETKDYLNYYYHGTKNPKEIAAQEAAVAAASAPKVEATPDTSVTPTERTTVESVERENPADSKQPIVNVTVPPQAPVKEKATTAATNVPEYLQRPKTVAPSTVSTPSTLDDMPVFISEAGLGLMQMGTI